MKARIRIPSDCTDYPPEAQTYQNQVAEVNRVYYQPLVPSSLSFRPYLTIKPKMKVMFWADWFYLDHVELLSDEDNTCKCNLIVLMNRGCRCGGK